MQNFLVIVRHAERLDDCSLEGSDELQQNPIEYEHDTPLSHNGHD